MWNAAHFRIIAGMVSIAFLLIVSASILSLQAVGLNKTFCETFLSGVNLEERLVAEVVQELLKNEASLCSLVLATDKKTSKDMQEVLRKESGNYRQLMSTRTHSFDFSWKNYPGLLRQEQLFSFRTIPPELYSRAWAGSCSLNVLMISTSLPEFLVQVAASVNIRISEDKFYIHFQNSNGFTEMLLPPADGLRLKLGSLYNPDKGNLQLSSVCFYCVNGQSVLSYMGHFSDSKQHAYMLNFPDTAERMHGRVMKTCHLDDVDMEDARRKWKDTGSKLYLSKEQRVFLEVEELFDVRVQVHSFDIVSEKLEYRYDNGTWTGVVGEILAGQADFSVAAFLTEESINFIDISYPLVFLYATFATRVPRGIVRWQVIFEPFCITCWCLLISSLFLSALALQKIYQIGCREQHRKYTFLSALHYVVRALVEQPVKLPQPSLSPVCLFAIAWWILAIVVTCGYKSKLVSFLTSPRKEWLPQNVEELVYDSDFTWGMHLVIFVGAKSLIPPANLPAFNKLLAKARLVEDMRSCLHYTLHQQFACISVNMEFNYYQNEFVDIKGDPMTYLIPEQYFNFYIAPVFGRGDPYAFTWKKAVKRAFEAKLYDKYIRDENLVSLFHRLTKMRVLMAQYEEEERKKDVLTMKKMTAMFRLWILSVALALPAFVLEVATCKKPSSMKELPQLFPFLP